ncbi:ThuA domain-containing protein [Litoribacter alkaliphilus]|uniref:ThuA domain-containing protein n=1 Tax=Litoribacter ruber TaxID=702568 RepID=A0AAP2CJZ3_9BACT|nr:ThuA domain-containing protein [Litoribacter alkaliphilus]MBS9525557.1 ThuA domain-containing protein [Litoribacter alkaliphilus]
MRKLFILLLTSLLPVLGMAQHFQFKAIAISTTEGFRHESIESGVEGLRKLAKENFFLLDHTEDIDIFASERLHEYDVIILLNTTGEIFLEPHQEGFKKFVRDGKGVVGIHSATDTAYEWEWFTKLIGAQFSSHPEIQTAKVKTKDNSHASTLHLPAEWLWTDEWYNFKNFNEDVKVLLEVDPESYDTGDKNITHHPIAWHHEYDGGRVFYTALGHVNHAYQSQIFLQHLMGGIWYAAKGREIISR